MALALINTTSCPRPSEAQAKAMSKDALSIAANTSLQPSDFRARARQALNSAAYSAVMAVKCEEKDGAIILSGTVPSFYLKQVAQQCVVSLGDDVRVINNTKVVYREKK